MIMMTIITKKRGGEIHGRMMMMLAMMPSKTLPQLLQTRVSETSSALLSQASAAAAAAISAATIRFNGRHDAELKAM